MTDAPALPLFAFLFSAPWTALATAAGAAAVPIIIHLLSRRRFRIVTWAAMRFLLAAQKQNVRRLRLEQLLLLAVRVALVVLVVAAMASVMPWAEEWWRRLVPGSVARVALGRPRTHKILVLDGSLSMAVKQGESSLFEQARELALELLDSAPAGDGFSVVLLASPPQRVVPEPADDPQRVAAEVRALRLPHGNADLARTLEIVAEMLRRSPIKFEAREIYFFTDLQRATWATGQTGEFPDLLQSIQERARTILVDVGVDGVGNLAVSDLTLGVPLATTGTPTPITATIRNYGDESKSVRAELWVGRARQTSTDPPLVLRAVAQQTLTVPPGGAGMPITFVHTFTSPGDYAVQVRLEGDALELDDVRSVVLAVKDSVPVLLVNGKPAADPYDQATAYLRDALNPYPTGHVPRDVAARPVVMSAAAFADAGRGDLTPFDCVFLCDVPRLGMSEIRRLEAHLKRGGGVVFTLGPRVDVEAYDRLMGQSGAGLLPVRLRGTQRAPTDRWFTLFGEEEAYHEPPLAAFAADADRAILQTVPFYEYVRVELPPRSPARKILAFVPEAATPSSAAAETALPRGDPALLAWPKYRGRVALLTSTVNTDWTPWPKAPSFPPLIQELLRYVVAGRLREQASVVGQTVEEILPSGSAGLDVAVQTPDGRSLSLRTEARDEAATFALTDTDQSGVYRATIGAHPREWLVAVNVPTAGERQRVSESDLARSNRAELETAYPGWEFQLVRTLKDVAPPAAADATPQAAPALIGPGVARGLLFLVFALLITETILAWRFGRTHAVPAAAVEPPSGWVAPAIIGVAASLIFLFLAAGLVQAAWSDDIAAMLPHGAREWLEDRLGIPRPVPGEGTRWRLEAIPFLTGDPNLDPWLVGAVVLGSLVLIGWIYRHDAARTTRSRRWLMAGLRVLMVLLALLVLLPQVQVVFERQSWPELALVIDDSASMSVADRYRDPEVAEVVRQLASQTGVPEPHRLQLAQALVASPERNWLEALLTQRQVKVHVYRCAHRAARLTSVTEASDLDAARAAILELQPTGPSSQLGAAVRQVLQDFRGSALSAIIMLTDGITTDGEDLPSAARLAAQMGVPLFLVGLGDAHETRDLILHDLRVDDSVYVNDRLVFEARVTGQGYSSLTVPVRLSEKGPAGQLRELARELVTVDPLGKPVKVRLTHQPTEPGEKVYVLDVPVQPDEAQPADNNRLERTVQVRDVRLIRVLYVEGYPRYEFRYVKSLLERELADHPRNKTIDLKVLLLDADEEYAVQDRSARADFPIKAELAQYDVVILGDVDPKHPKLGEKNLQLLAEFVRDQGGGLLVIAGERHGPHVFRRTPLEDILPIVLGPDPAGRSEWVEAYRPQLTPIGRMHPIFRFSPDEGENTAIWERLAPLYWWAEGYAPQPAAEVLAVHPRQRLIRPGKIGSPGDERHPLIVQHFVGAGRCLFLGIDETWRWRLREDELRFNQFWIQTVRYLSRSRLGRIELRLDRESTYRRAEPIRITVRFPDEAPPPAAQSEIKVVVERRPLQAAPTAPRETEVQTLHLGKVEGSRATYEALLTRTPEGHYRFWLSAPVVSGVKPWAECRVLPPPGEMDRLRMNQSDLERAAEESRGRFYTLADASRLIRDLPAGPRLALNSPRPPWLVWNHPGMFALLVWIVGSEWALRKRNHLA